MNNQEIDYPFLIRRLTREEGGGFLIEFPDLPGCMSDGETIPEAIQNGRDAVRCWLIAAKESGREIPKPGEESQSGKWVQRVPKTLHTRLAARAKQEGVSLNTLVVSMIAEGLGKRYEIPKSTLKSTIRSTQKFMPLKRKVQKTKAPAKMKPLKKTRK